MKQRDSFIKKVSQIWFNIQGFLFPQGRPKKGEERIKNPTRLERQQSMTVDEMLEDLPEELVETKKQLEVPAEKIK